MPQWLPKLTDSDQPRYIQIAEAIRSDLEKGVLQVGEKLPSQRQVAQEISIDTSTISRAYVEAARRGYVSSHVGRGTFVRDPATTKGQDPRRSAEEDLRMNMPPEPSDPRLIGQMQEGLQEVSANLVPLLRYQSPIGSRHDRELAVDWMQANSCAAEIERLAVAPGAHAAVLAVLIAIRTPKLTVFCEETTYPGIRSLAASLGIPLVGLDCDASGVLPDALDAALAAATASALYLNPTLNNPTTRTVPTARREEIASVLSKHQTPLIEDDAYVFVASNPPSSITSMVPDLGWHIAGLSKCFGAGLRLAFATAPSRELFSRFVQNLRSSNVMASPISTALASTWIKSGTASHLQSFMREETQHRQHIANEELAGCSFESDPEAFNVWLSLPEDVTRAEVLSRMPERQIGIVPSDAFAAKGTPEEAFRVCLGGAVSRKQLRSDLSALRSAILEEHWVG